jgi:lipopolysaccharide export system permease protein
MRPRLHDSYLAGSFAAALAIALVAFITIFIVVDLFEKVDTYVDNRVPFATVVKYNAYKIPQIVHLVLPVAMLLGCLFGIGNLSRRNEILPLQNAGLSANRILLPIYVLGVLATVLSFAAGDALLPEATFRINKIWREEIRKETRARTEYRSNVTLLGEGGRLYLIGRYNAPKKEMRDVVIQRFAEKTLVERVDAREATWRGDRWVFRHGFVRTFHEDSEEARAFEEMTIPDLKEVPKDFARPDKEPDEMNIRELRDFVRRTVASGSTALKEETEMHRKVADPFCNLILVLLGTPLAARRRRSGLAMSFALAVGIAFLYYGAIRVGQALGQNETLPPLVAAWIGNLLFGTVAAVLLAKYTR